MTLKELTIIFLAYAVRLTLCASEFTVERANQYIAENEDKVNKTYREVYHASAPIGWINDPNGFIYFRGEYHLFYQYNPYATQAGNIHWGHAKSKDLIHWENLPVALAPDRDYDKNGVFSGSAIEKDRKLYVMYTGNMENRQVQCIAISEDGIHFEKVEENPVLDASTLPSNAQPQDFRDPRVFKRGNTYYSIIVSKTVDETGQVLLYQSADLIKWQFKSILLQGTKEQGIMWECPDLFELDGKDVLILSAIHIPPSGDNYQNIHSVIEFIGKVDWDEGKFEVESLKELDHGLDFYATQSLLDNRDRRIVIAWMNMWERNYPTSQLNQGWTGAMTLPRELHIANGFLTQAPISEVRSAYDQVTATILQTLNDETKTFDGVAGKVAALELVVNLADAKLFEIQLRADDHEETVVRYDTDSQELALDRTNSGVDIVGGEQPPLRSRQVKVSLEDNKLKLQVFLDNSSVEVFANDGVETLTTTIYPKDEASDSIRFRAEGKAVIESLAFSKIHL